MLGFLGTGHCLPDVTMTNDDWAKRVDTSDEWIVSKTGIRSRQFLAPDQTALSITSQAAKNALNNAGISAKDLGLIICATFTADDVVPSLSCSLLRELGASCPAFDVNAACSGFIYAVKIAMSMYTDKPILVVGTEIMIKVTDMSDRSNCVLFGDGSGAAVIGETGSTTSGILSCKIMAYPDEKLTLHIPGINHKADGEISPSYLSMAGPEVYKFATRVMESDIKEALAENNLTTADVKWIVPHQANLRIIQTASKLLNIPMEQFFVNIDHVGNTSCASVGIALDGLVQTGKLEKGDLMVMNAFGGGLTSGSIIFRW